MWRWTAPGACLISPELRQAAGISKDTMLLGMGNHFELWDKTTYDAQEAQAMQGDMPDVFKDFSFLNAMSATALTHTTVLLNEAVDALLQASAGADGAYVDATFGRGGHSRLILSRLSAQGRLLAFDKDLEAIAEAGRIEDGRFSIRHEGFSNLGELPLAVSTVS
jgi:hypothetical protein